MQVSTLGGETSAIPTPFLVNQIGDISPDRSSLLVPAYAGSRERGASLGCCPFPQGRPTDWGNCLAMTEPGLRMDSEYSLPMAMTYTSPGLMERNPKNFCPSQALPIGHAGRQTVHVCAFQCLTQRLDHIRYGKSRPTEVILILCCPAGAILPRNAAAVGHRMGSTSSFSPITTVRHRSGPFPKKAACSAKPDREPTRVDHRTDELFPPDPSLDGKRLFAIGSQPRGELARFNQKTQQFEPYLSGISAEGVDFSRDGQWVTYVTYPEGSLWRSKADGSERLQLTFPPMQVLLATLVP